MFVWQSSISFAFLICCIASLFVSFVCFHSKDSLLDSLPIIRNVDRSGYQKRYWISKDLLYTNVAGDRMQLKLRSREANVQFLRSGNKNTLVEHISGLKGVLQEKLYYLLPNGTEIVRNSDGKWEGCEDSDMLVDLERAKPMQTVCFFEAKEANFQNNTGKIKADAVTVSKVNLPGHQIPKKIETDKKVMEGQCDKLQFNLLEKNLTFSADGFHLEVYDS